MFMFSEDETEKEELSEGALDEVLEEEPDDEEEDALALGITEEEEGKEWA